MIKIDKPILNRKTAEENIAVIEKWIANTADELNVYISRLEKEIKENGNKEDKPD